MYDINEEKELLAQLGKHSTGKGCLYLKKLADIDLEGETYTTIGTTTNPFQGTFDGRNHTISRMTISSAGMDEALIEQRWVHM